MGCRVCQWPEMPEFLSSGLRIQAFALTHHGLLPELKLGKGCVCAGSKQKNAGFLSLIKKPPLHPLMKTYLLIKKTTTKTFQDPSLLGIDLDTRDQVQPRYSPQMGQDSRWLFKAKR